MNIEANKTSPQEAELARRFAQMRLEDVSDLPSLPDENAMASQSPAVIAKPSNAVVTKIAVGIAAVLVISVLVNTQEPQNPGLLYAEIMNANILETDQFMSVSQGTLPEMASVPYIFELDAPAGRADNIN